MVAKRLYRSDKDRMIGGVCAGIAEYFNIDPVFIRIFFIVLLIRGSFGFLVYILMLIIVPNKSKVAKPKKVVRKKNK